VEFSGVEKFLDTPVKRYSSGMYVRLAFAVAAHMEPEILVIDEVLAVGDAEFQKKCLGKMNDVAGQGRTVLFVSHNMSAIQSLCSISFLLRDGYMVKEGHTRNVIVDYLTRDSKSVTVLDSLKTSKRTGLGELRFLKLTLRDEKGNMLSKPITGETCKFEMDISGQLNKPGVLRAGLTIKDSFGRPLILFANEASVGNPMFLKGDEQLICHVDKFPLTEGEYGISLFLEVDSVIQDWIEDGIFLEVETGLFFDSSRNTPNGWNGKTVLVDNTWYLSSETGHK